MVMGLNLPLVAASAIADPPSPPAETPPVASDLTPGAPNPPAEPAVFVQHLARRFGSRFVLRDVTFSVAVGKSLGIAGANGSGKTVLLRLLAALDRPTAGVARIQGDDTLRQAGRVRRRVGFVPEEPQLYEGITAQQYLDFVGRARGLGKQLRAASVDTLFQVVGLESLRDRAVDEFSPGEKRRLMLAGALVHEPEVLLLDDPLRALDGQSRLEQLEVLRELRQLGATMVLTATRPDDVLDVCDEVAVLRGGTIAWRGDRAAADRLGATGSAGIYAGAGDSPALRVRADVLDDVEAALTLLSQHRDVRELEIERPQEDGAATEIWFLFLGDRDGLAALLPQLVRAGCILSHFGVERRSPANAISALFRSPA